MTFNNSPGMMRQLANLVFATVLTVAAFSLLVAPANAFGAELDLIKEVDNTGGGTAVAADFSLSASGPDGLFSGNGFASASDLPAGTYVLAEDTNVASYLAGDWVCDGGALAGNELTLESEAAVTCVITNTFLPDPSLAITKVVRKVGSADGSTVTAAGDVISYDIVTTNTGNVALTGVTVSDPLITSLSCAWPTAEVYLAIGETVACSGTYAVIQADLDSNGGGDGDIDNTATADSDQTGPSSDSAEVLVEQNPGLAFDKQVVAVDRFGDGVLNAVGDVIYYALVVSNTGNVTLTNVVVTDPLTGTNVSVGSLQPGGSSTVSASYAITQADLDSNGGGDGDIDNTATADSDQTGPTDDSKEVPVEQNPGLGFDKQVVAVDEVGDKVLNAAGDVIDYALVVSNTGNVTLTNVTVTDPLTGTNENIGDLAPGQTATVDASYAVTQADLDTNGGGDGDIDNTATADSDQTDPADDSAEVPVVQSPANSAPVADDDAYDATEDTQLSVSAPGVLDGDTDADSDELTAALDSGVSYGVLVLDADGSFTYDPAENFCGDDSFTYHANDGTDDSNIATVSITVACVNDLPEVTSVSPLSQTVDYSDDIATVTVVVTDIDNASTTLAESGEPTASISSLSLTEANPACVTDNTLTPNLEEIGSVCTWTYDGQVLSPGDNTHNIVFTASDADGDGTVTGTHELTIEPEDATVMLDSGNDVAAEVAVPGGNSGEFSLYFAAYETDNPDISHGKSADFGDLNNMEPFMTLIPVGPGNPQDGVCVFIANLPIYPEGAYDQVATFECTFDDVPVNTYEVEAKIDGASDTTRYYQGTDDDVFTVFDPSLGFTSGGGWFYWPGTDDETLTDCGPDGYPGDKTNFGFNLKYNKKRKTAKGSVLMMRHTVDDNCLDAGSYRVKSNAIEGMSLGEGEDGDGAYGWAAVAGKSTYRELELDNEGNHPFLMYVEDHGQQGCEQAPADEFWIEVKDKDGVIVMQLNGPDPAGPNEGAEADDEPIVCGNITVPHKAGKGSGGDGPKDPNPNKPPKG